MIPAGKPFRAARRLGIVLAVFASLPSFAQPESDATQAGVVVRSSVQADGGPVIGQRVRVLIDVLFPDMMTRPPQVDMPQTPGAQIFRFESQGITRYDTIGGKPYVGQRFEFALYPRRGGSIVVPPANVHLLNRQGDEIGTATGEAQRIEVAVPPGVDATQPVTASTHVTLRESWAPATGASFKTGDALVRTVTRVADDVPGLGFLSFTFKAPDGVHVYVDQPQSDDKLNRGEITGTRVDRATYVFEKPGSYTLPAVSQPWWDLSAKALRYAASPPRKVTVTAAPAPRRSVSWLPGGDRNVVLALGAMMVLVIGGILIQWRRSLPFMRALEACRQRRAASEGAAFRALERIGATGDAGSAYRAFLSWAKRLPANASLSTGSPSQRGHAPPLLDRLERSLFGDPDSRPIWSPRSDGREFVAQLRGLRRELLARRQADRPSPLPPLNP